MELFERLRYIAEKQNISLAKIAGFVGVSPQAFNKWLTKKSQHNIWEHLDKIEKAVPDLRREWLWWGEGEMLKGETPEPAETCAPPEPAPHATDNMTAELARLRAELDEANRELHEANRLNRQLVTKLFVDGAGDKDEQTNIGKTANGAK